MYYSPRVAAATWYSKSNTTNRLTAIMATTRRAASTRYTTFGEKTTGNDVRVTTTTTGREPGPTVADNDKIRNRLPVCRFQTESKRVRAIVARTRTYSRTNENLLPDGHRSHVRAYDDGGARNVVPSPSPPTKPVQRRDHLRPCRVVLAQHNKSRNVVVRIKNICRPRHTSLCRSKAGARLSSPLAALSFPPPGYSTTARFPLGVMRGNRSCRNFSEGPTSRRPVGRVYDLPPAGRLRSPAGRPFYDLPANAIVCAATRTV